MSNGSSATPVYHGYPYVATYATPHTMPTVQMFPKAVPSLHCGSNQPYPYPYAVRYPPNHFWVHPMMWSNSLATKHGVPQVPLLSHPVPQVPLPMNPNDVQKKHYETKRTYKEFLETDTSTTNPMEKEQQSEYQEKNKKFFCMLCPKGFTLKSNLTRHLRVVHNKKRRDIIDSATHVQNPVAPTAALPEVARETPSDGNSVIANTNDSNGIKENEKRQHCPQCPRSFLWKSHLEKHIRLVHNKEKRFQCSECKKFFSQRGDLNRHTQTVHRGEKRFRCLECNKAFGWKSHLTNHTRTVHRKERRFRCEECHKAFGEKGTLKTHVRIVHRGEKRYKCDECDKAFGVKGHLNRHIRTVHRREKSYECSSCKRSFGVKSNLKNHIKRLHNGD